MFLCFFGLVHNWASARDVDAYRIYAYASINDHADVSSKVRSLIVGLSLHLHQYFVYVSSDLPKHSDKYRKLKL